MMSRNSNIAPFEEDFFAGTRMSFGDHLEDLRGHLLRAVYGFVLAFVIAMFLSYYVLDFIKRPVEKALMNYHLDDFANEMQRRSVFRERIHERVDANNPEEPLNALVKPTPMKVHLSPAEMDGMMRRLYPQLFGNGGPLAEAPAPPPDGPSVTVQVTTKPLEVLDSMQEAVVLSSKRTTLSTLSVMEMFFVYFKVAIVTGFVLGSPWIIFQIWKFIAAGLYPHERKYFTGYLPLAISLFLGGVAVCQFLIIPAALDALLSFNKWLGIEPELRMTDWLSFAIWMPVITGLCFETPLAMVLMHKIGLFSSADYYAKWRHAAFVMCIIAAVVTPSVDPFSLLFVWVPMVGLYFLGIFMVKRIEQRERTEDLSLEEEVPYQPAEEVTGSAGD